MGLPPLPEPTDEEMDYLLNSPPRKQKSPSPRIVKDVVMSEDPESPGYKFFKWALKRQKDFNAPPTAMFDQGLWREFLNSRDHRVSGAQQVRRRRRRARAQPP